MCKKISILYCTHRISYLDTFTAAVPDEDFFLTNLSIEAISTLHGPNDSLCFNIMVKQDEFVENKECFEVGISLPDSVSSDLMVELDEGKDTAVVCIQDDDCKSCSIYSNVQFYTTTPVSMSLQHTSIPDNLLLLYYFFLHVTMLPPPFTTTSTNNQNSYINEESIF